MKTIKVLWIEDDDKFPHSVIFRIERTTKELKLVLDSNEIIKDGRNVWELVRDWTPDLIMMDHNLQDVTINGANLIISIRFHNNDTPIIFYSSDMNEELILLVEGENEVSTSSRGDVHDELITLLKRKFI